MQKVLELWRAHGGVLRDFLMWISGLLYDIGSASTDFYYAYRHRRFVRAFEHDQAHPTKYDYGFYLKDGRGGVRDIRGVSGTTWTLDGDEEVDTREIHSMVIARLEMGYS